MSSCLVIQTKDKAFIGADTAISSLENNKFLRVGKTNSKIFVVGDFAFFCSGKIQTVYNMLSFIEKKNKFDPNEISKFLKNEIRANNDVEFFDIEILAINNSTKNIYQISQYKNFDVCVFPPSETGTRILSAGFKTNQTVDFAEKELLLGKDVSTVYINTFNNIACEEIGDKLIVYFLEKSIDKFYDGNIFDGILQKPYLSKMDLRLLVADVIVGRLLAGNSLTITNEGSNFTVDKDGCRLNNASFIIQNSKTAILLSPVDGTLNGLSGKGITIQSHAKGYWEKVFYADTEGNLVLKGGITADFGSFGGWTISEEGIYDTHGNYINSTGKVKLGGLTIDGTNARFNGDIYATTFHGKVIGGTNILPKAIDPTHIDYLSADSITVGTLSADRIYGGIIRGPGGIEMSIGMNTEGILGLSANQGVRIFSKSKTTGGMAILGDANFYYGRNIVATGGQYEFNDNSIYASNSQKKIQGYGVTGTFILKDSAGNNKTLSFANGILVDGRNNGGGGGIPPTGGTSLVWDKTTLNGTDTIRSAFANYNGTIQPLTSAKPTYLTINATYFDDAKTHIHVYGLNQNGQRIITGNVIPPTTTAGLTYVKFINTYPVLVKSFELEIDAGGSSFKFVAGATISTGTVQGTDSVGVPISTVQGELYCIESSNGPYTKNTGQTPFWNAWDIQLDGTGNYGYCQGNVNSFVTVLPDIAEFGEAMLDNRHCRLYFYAPSSQILYRTADGFWSDNGGSIDYILRSATVTGRTVKLGTSYVIN